MSRLLLMIISLMGIVSGWILVDLVPASACSAALRDSEIALQDEAVESAAEVAADSGNAAEEVGSLASDKRDEPANEASQESSETEEATEHPRWVPSWQTNDPVFLFGLVMAILGFVFWSSSSELPIFKKFYSVVPMLLLCYFLPSLLTMSGLAGHEASESLYKVASRYLLPACLVLLTMCVDLKQVLRLGPKALIMFFAGTVGVVLGGPLAVILVSLIDPSLISLDGQDATWRGLSTVAGSWIGGGANQTAMKVMFEPSNQLFSQMVAVDIIVAEMWMALLLIGVGHSQRIDRWLSADASSIELLKEKMEQYNAKHARNPTTTELMVMAAVGFFYTGVGHYLGNWIAESFGNYSWAGAYSLDSGFFWLILIATLCGLGLSFTRARELNGAGASKLATVFIFILVGTIGLQMDLWALFESPGIFVIGFIWMAFHVGIMVFCAWLIRAPYFFLAVGSKANIGGAASAPVVAAAFHPSLAPVGVLLAVLGYVLGTVGAYLAAILMRAASEGMAG